MRIYSTTLMILKLNEGPDLVVQREMSTEIHALSLTDLTGENLSR